MEFDSLDEALRYVRDRVEDAMQPMGNKMADIMGEEVKTQVYDSYTPNVYKRKGQLAKCHKCTEVGKYYATAEYVDEGDWFSILSKRKKHMFPIPAFESGKVWDKGTDIWHGVYKYREATKLMENSYNKCLVDIPREFKEYLERLGFDVE